MLFTPELLSMGLGAASGFLFKYLAQQSQDRQQIFEMLLKRIQAADDSADKAAIRDTSKAGQWIRRFLVVSLVFGIIIAPFLLTLINKDTIVEVQTPTRSLLSIFNWGGVTKFYSLNGYLITQELRCSVLAVVGYYFGQSSVTKR